MYLKFLFVEGFKSFPEPSGLELDPGVCVFVGGNGTGKSNLTDAVTWALGETELTALRCRSSADLVFAGSDGLLPMSAGEVTLVLDRRPQRIKLEALPIGACKHGHAANHTREVPDGSLTLTRRVSEGGETALLLDGRPASEDELAARLDDFGMGRPPVAVIRQGELERLLLLDPAARRRVIEEAVGIPELSKIHAVLAERSTEARLHLQHLLGEREEAAARVAVLESEAGLLKEAAALEQRRSDLRAMALRKAKPPTDTASPDGAPSFDELLVLLGLPPMDRVDDPDRDPGSWEHLRSELEACEAHLRDLGPVNTRAADDLAVAIAHRSDLDSAIGHAEGEIASLEGDMRTAQAEMASVFATALARIEDRFRTYYAMLAPGGEASLAPSEGGAGVDIMVRPPGKVLDRVSTLSGGERSLAALSLALAVFQEYESPIFVLDEVEPALDDTNIRRLQAVLDSVADSRQLLVVSHQQRAKETGDVVFGVERNLDGASQVKFRFEPATRRLDVYRRTWTADHLRKFSGDRVKAAAPGLAADTPATGRAMAGGAGSPMQAALMEIRGPRSGSSGYRPREDGPWEGIWESLGNPDSTGKTRSDEDDGPGKTCC